MHKNFYFLTFLMIGVTGSVTASECVENQESFEFALCQQDNNDEKSQFFTRLSKVLKYGIVLRLVSMEAVDIINYCRTSGINQMLLNNFYLNEEAYNILFLYCACEGFYWLGDKVKHLDKAVDCGCDKLKQLWTNNLSQQEVNT